MDWGCKSRPCIQLVSPSGKHPKKLFQCIAKNPTLGVPVTRRPLETNVHGLVVNVDPLLTSEYDWKLPLVSQIMNLRMIEILAQEIHLQDLLPHVIAVGVSAGVGWRRRWLVPLVARRRGFG